MFFGWEGKGGGVGRALIQGLALINFLCLKDEGLFEVGANLRLGAYLNKINMVLFCWMVIYPVDSIVHLLNNQGHTILHLVQASKVKCEARGEQDTPCPSPSSFTHLSQSLLARVFLCFSKKKQ